MFTGTAGIVTYTIIAVSMIMLEHFAADNPKITALYFGAIIHH